MSCKLRSWQYHSMIRLTPFFSPARSGADVPRVNAGVSPALASSRPLQNRYRPRSTGWLIVLCLCAFGLACGRCEAGPSSAPNGSVPAALFPVTEARLTNGLQLLTVEDHHCPIVAVQVWYHVGSADEPAGRHGFAHLFEHLMFRGTDRLGPSDHMDLIKGAGGDGNAYTSFDETCYQETLPAHQLELALWLESERMAFLTVDTAGFSTERKVVEEERRMDLNQPYGDILDKGLPAVFGAHPYANSPIGTIRDLRQATPSDAHAWWAAWYTPNNATLVLVGDVEPDRVRVLAERCFAWIPAVEQPARNIPAVAPVASPRRIVLKLDNAPAPAVGLVWRTVPEGHPDSLPLKLLATILGGGDSARLYRRLVAEDHRAVAALAMQYGLKQGGLFGAAAVLNPIGGKPARTVSVLRSELDRLRKEGISEEEFEKARNQAVSGLVLGAETVFGKAQSIGKAAVVGTGVSELNGRLERLRRLTREDLQRAARLHLDPQHALTVTVPGYGLLGHLSRLVLGDRTAEETAPTAAAPEVLLRGRPGVVRPADRPVRPPVNEDSPPIPKPTVCEHWLANGLRVLISPNPKAPALHVVLALPYGSWAEEKPGTAALTLTMLSKGTELHDEKALAEELEQQAIQLSGSVDQDDSRVQTTCLPEQAERAFSLLAEVVRRPTFPQTSLNTAVAQSMTELTVGNDDPATVAEREFSRHLFAGHPYGRRLTGEAADMRALRRDDLAGFWCRTARPERATLAIAGALTEEDALALSQRFFGSWQRSGGGPIAEPGPPPEAVPTRILLVDWPGATQSEIRIGGLGLARRDPDKPVADLVSSYFGGSFGSRLMKAIRIEKGDTYGVRGGFHSSRFSGTFEVSTFTKTSSTAATLRLALEEIDGLLERPPAAEELSLHRRSFLGSAAAHFETSEQVADYLARLSLNRRPLDYLPRMFAVINGADAPRCQALARRLVNPGQLLIVIVGDASRIRREIETIAPTTVLDRKGRFSQQHDLQSPKAKAGRRQAAGQVRERSVIRALIK